MGEGAIAGERRQDRIGVATEHRENDRDAETGGNGEEESGSPSVTPFLEREAARWACDVVVSADGLMWDEDHHSLVLSSKGMAGGQIDIFTADIDAHSGIYGATVHNAADVTARIAAELQRPLREIVGVTGDRIDVLVEEFVEPDEVRAAHVPMRLPAL